LIFYVPEFTQEELSHSIIFGFAYSMPNLPVLSQGSMLGFELLGAGRESIAKWMAEYFSREAKTTVTHKFGRVSVGLRGASLPVYCFGIAFLTAGKSENVSQAEINIAEMYKLNAQDLVPDFEYEDIEPDNDPGGD